MTSPKKIYWDTSCFLCFLNPVEIDRRLICEDVLRHANLGDIEIWISVWAIIEVIRPKKPGNAPLPPWATKAIAAVPEAREPLEDLWRRFQRASPSQKLTDDQIAKIQQMFEWPFLKKIYIDERMANKAVQLERDCGIKPADAVHAACAILAGCDVIQRWDKDFDRVKHLIEVTEPKRITAQEFLIPDYKKPIGPEPKDFTNAQNRPKPEQEESG